VEFWRDYAADFISSHEAGRFMILRRPRVVITGMGILAANGIGVHAFWDALIKGRHGMAPITLYDTTDYAIKVAGEVKNFDLADYVNGEFKAKRLARHTQFAVVATRMAVEHAGLTPDHLKRHTSASINFGISTSAIEIIHACYRDVNNKGPGRVNPFLLAASQPNDVVAVLGGYLGINDRMTLSTACSAGMDAVVYSDKLIREGKVDLVVAGGADAPINSLTMASFSAAGVLPEATLENALNRPFDTDRKGGLFAEGSAVIIMERLEHALARGATPLAEILGHGSVCDNDRSGTLENMSAAIRSAMDNAGVMTSDIQHISAHGTGNAHLDVRESLAIKEVFGASAAGIPTTSIKGSVGNPLSAAGVMQIVAGICAMQSGMVPPTANLDTIDPACSGLLHVQGEPLFRTIDRVLVNTHGMGGSNTCMILGKARAA